MPEQHALRKEYPSAWGHIHRSLWQRCHIDFPLLCGLILLSVFGLIILYSAASQNPQLMMRQIMRLGLSFGILILIAQIAPHHLKRWGPFLFGITLILLGIVLIAGVISKGAQRWIPLGFASFQPSEIMKLALPLTLAKLFSDGHIPPSWRKVTLAGILLLIPAALIAKQPDLGTALMVSMAGFSVIIFAGLRWRVLISLLVLVAGSAPILWHFLHRYQQERVLTFLNPERDPLGSGYHIIQSKIAIGSGGILGKGWLQGTQAHLNFLPEHTTDFIFAVCGEEFGFWGCLILLSLYAFIIARGFMIAYATKDMFSKLLAASLTVSFFIAVFINIGMVSGILPVVGLPLPLVSYGGSSMLTFMTGFGVLMAIQTHRRLLG